MLRAPCFVWFAVTGGAVLLFVGCSNAPPGAMKSSPKEPEKVAAAAHTDAQKADAGHTAHEATPKANEAAAPLPGDAADEAERKLFLTPGGLYTQADIEANGGVVASLKFKGLKAQHDLSPKAGDRICPISMTKANPIFSWVIGGKSYSFCCPPCVEEFLALAKTKPDEVKPPEHYVKADAQNDATPK